MYSMLCLSYFIVCWKSLRLCNHMWLSFYVFIFPSINLKMGPFESSLITFPATPGPTCMIHVHPSPPIPWVFELFLWTKWFAGTLNILSNNINWLDKPATTLDWQTGLTTFSSWVAGEKQTFFRRIVYNWIT